MEQICSKRMLRVVLQYLLKWAGWDQADNSWESVTNLYCQFSVLASV